MWMLCSYCFAKFILITYWFNYVIINDFAKKRSLSLAITIALNMTKETFAPSQLNSLVIL